MSKHTPSNSNRPIYVQYKGDTYRFAFNSKGQLTAIYRCAFNDSSREEFINYNELDPHVIQRFEEVFLQRITAKRIEKDIEDFNLFD